MEPRKLETVTTSSGDISPEVFFSGGRDLALINPFVLVFQGLPSPFPKMEEEGEEEEDCCCRMCICPRFEESLHCCEGGAGRHGGQGAFLFVAKLLAVL